jgi:hypothetical protein
MILFLHECYILKSTNSLTTSILLVDIDLIAPHHSNKNLGSISVS